MEKLELKHLAPYLPYGLMIAPLDKIRDNNDIILRKFLMIAEEMHLILDKRGKPILRPLSDLFEVDRDYDFSLSELITYGAHNEAWLRFDVRFIYQHDLEILLKHHFDIFGLIEKGLATDINTLEQ